MIKQIYDNKKQYLELLLLGDEQESMINSYLDYGNLFVMQIGDETIAVAVVVDLGDKVCELKNIAVCLKYQRNGYARELIRYLIEHYRESHQSMIVGTGDTPSTGSFYTNCGFIYSYRVANFFTDNYDHEIIEEGVKLVDMVYYKIKL